MRRKNAPIAIIIATLSIVANIILGALLLTKPDAPVAPQSETAPLDLPQAKDTTYPFLSKRIFAENQNDILINFTPLRQALREYIEKIPDPVGMYFEYLPSGTSIGINDKMELRLASLIKTPLVMGVYRQIEQKKISQDTTITLTQEDIDPKFGDVWKRGVGAQLSVREAIDLTLIKSDNTTANALLEVVPINVVDEVFDSLDIQTSEQGEVDLISPKNYSSIFRSLYLASYVSRDSSNEILDILSRTDFNDQIAAGVPKNITIAHKIGVYNRENARSDCGIIYVPKRPYLLCVMVKADETKAKEHMQLISKMVYGYVVAVP